MQRVRSESMECIVNGSEGSSVHLEKVKNLYHTNIFPADITLRNAAKLCLEYEIPIRMDYFIPSLDGTVMLGLDKYEKVLIRFEDNIPIIKIYNAGKEYIILTRNAIFIISDTIKAKSVKFETGS